MAECAAVSGSQRLAAIVVAILIVVGIAVVAATLADGGVAADPSPSASVSPGESPSSSDAPTGEPSPADEDEVLAALAEIEEQVIAIRGLPAADIGPPDLLTRDELREELLASFEEDYPPDEQAADNAALKALGLLEPDQDIAELQLQLLGEGVLGFYDDVEKRMVIVTDEGLDALAKFTYAHEYTHALQDAAFDLSSLETEAEGEDDRSMALIAFVEGDATVTMLSWAFQHLSQDELAEIATVPPPDTSGIPSWLVEQLTVFPYNEGLLWAGAVTDDPLSPNFAALDEVYADPPNSTEQIVDFEKWEAREEPIPVEVVDLAAAFGDGWTEVDNTPIGEAFLRMMLEYHGIPLEEARTASAGWGGDRVVVAIGPDDAFAVAWRLAWDSPEHADEFVEAYNAAIATFDFPASVTELGSGEVLVAHGSSDEILRRTVDAAND
jgi:hypothetical protein